jgi:hypothetical protein
MNTRFYGKFYAGCSFEEVIRKILGKTSYFSLSWE